MVVICRPTIESLGLTWSEFWFCSCLSGPLTHFDFLRWPLWLTPCFRHQHQAKQTTPQETSCTNLLPLISPVSTQTQQDPWAACRFHLITNWIWAAETANKYSASQFTDTKQTACTSQHVTPAAREAADTYWSSGGTMASGNPANRPLTEWSRSDSAPRPSVSFQSFISRSKTRVRPVSVSRGSKLRSHEVSGFNVRAVHLHESDWTLLLTQLRMSQWLWSMLPAANQPIPVWPHLNWCCDSFPPTIKV